MITLRDIKYLHFGTTCTIGINCLIILLVLQAGWKENLATFINELKNLQCLGLTTMGAALKHAFDVLNINRMQTGIDTYGQGRCPFYLEPSVIVVITDGGKLSSNAGIQEEVSDIVFYYYYKMVLILFMK